MVPRIQIRVSLASRFSLFAVLLVTVVLLVPTAAAWSLAPQRTAPTDFAAWTTELAPSAFPDNPAGPVTAAVACALGDVTGDGVADLLVLVQDPAAGVQRLTALAGPGFEQVVWEKASSLTQVLRCAPDLDLDGTLDPILTTIAETTGTATAGATDQATRQVQQVIDGASGAVLLGRAAADTATGAATSAAGGAAGAAQEAASALLPAAAGAAAFLQTKATTALLPIPAGVPLPVDALTATVTQSAQLQVLDAAGAVVATVQIDQAGVEVLAMTTLALAGGLPDVAVLTRTLGPIQEVATGVPELALYAADGTLSWATRLPASTGLPILIPQAGDLNLDGVGDLVVTTAQKGVETAPAAAFWVLSGIDGEILFDSGAAVEGLMTAVPLGALPDGPALLRAASGTAGPLALSALDGAGSVLWSVEVDRLAQPVNAVLDSYTGELTGFTDLTGDAVPDVAVSIVTSAGLSLQAIDGLTGAIAWSVEIADADRVVPVIAGAASQAAGLAGQVNVAAQAATGAVMEVQAGATAALLALGTSATAATVQLIDPLTGAVQWVSTAAVPMGAGLASLSAHAAGDLDGDGLQDLLVTANFNASASVMATRSLGSRSVAEGDGSSPGSVSAVSGDSGQTLYSTSGGSGGSGLQYETSSVPAAESDDEDGEGKGIPGPLPVSLVVALGLATLWRRRRL